MEPPLRTPDLANGPEEGGGALVAHKRVGGGVCRRSVQFMQLHGQLVSGRIGVRPSGVHLVLLFPGEGLDDALSVRQRLKGNQLSGLLVLTDDLIGQPPHQADGDRRRNRRDQANHIREESDARKRGGQKNPFYPKDLRHSFQHLFIRQNIDAADVQVHSRRFGRLQRANQIFDDVADRDRLTFVLSPAGNQDDEEVFHQMFDDFIGGAAGPHDDRRPQEGHRHLAARQLLGNLHPAAQVIRQTAAFIAQTAQIDDARNMGPFGGLAKIGGGLNLGFLKLTGSEKERMNQVIGRVDILHGRVQALRPEGVRHHNFRAGPSCLIHGGGKPHHCPDLVSADQQFRHQPTADVSGGAGDQDLSDFGPAPGQ